MTAGGTRTGAVALLGPLLASSAYVLEIALVPLLLPAIQRSGGLSIQDLTWVLNVYAVAVTAGVLLGGALGDRLGPERSFLIGTVVFVLGSLGAAVVTGLEGLLVARAVQGFGGGLFSPAVPILIARLSEARPGRVLSLWNAFSGLLLAVAPVVALPLLTLFGWQSIFALFALLVLPAIVLMRSATPPRPPGTTPTGPGASAHLAAIGRLARHGPTALLLAYVALTYGIAVLFLFTVPLRFAEAETGRAAWTLGAFWAAFTLTGLLQSAIVDGRHARRLLVASPLLLLAGFGMFLFGAQPAAQIAAAVVTGTGFAFGNATSTMLILRHAPPGTSATAASLDITCARLGSVATVAGLAALSDAALFLGIGALGLVAAALARLVRQRPAPCDRQAPAQPRSASSTAGKPSRNEG